MPSALAAETFLADISQNIAKGRLSVKSLMPIGIDPHEFEPVPKDFVQISESRILIINGGGIEGWLEKALENSKGSNYIIEASKGLEGRIEVIPESSHSNDGSHIHENEIDPHFWLDPNYVIEYAKNIRDGFKSIDSDGKSIYDKNTEEYILKLKELDNWIKRKVSILPENQRLIVTNHESLGYFADRYGFKIIGTIIPGFSTDSSITAKEFAELIEKVKSSGVKVIFLETGSNSNLAQQLAQETGIKVIYNLYTHSTSDYAGDAPTYIDMMKFNVNTIINSLK
ncbi:metal ABC transporter substrate-binding protein [bacterium]|nr:metal ABC transporter substrate-binding protein [bacterium]